MKEERDLEVLQRVLGSPDLRLADSRAIWDRVRDALGDALHDLLVRLGGPVGEAAQGREGWISLGVLGFSLLVLGILVFVVSRALGGAVVADGKLARTAAAVRRERSDRLWQQALALAETGAYGEAVRSLYLSALFALQEHAVLDVQDALTNREYAQRLAGAHARAGPSFASLVEQYDRLRYGGGEADAAAFDRVRGDAERVRAVALAA